MRLTHITSFILMLIVAPGCNSIINKQINQESDRLKEPSLTRSGITDIEDEPLDSFIDKRVAPIFTGAKVYQYPQDPNRYQIRSDSAGVAVAVSKQGYFLTAAHCVDTQKDLAIILPSTSGPRKHPARIVWWSKDYDIALVSIETALEHVFDLAHNTPEPNTVVIAGGLIKHSAGRVLSLAKVSSTQEGLALIDHNCPIVTGDSGGPLISKDGLLLGINHSTKWKRKIFSARVFYNYKATAVDPNWLQDQINRDINHDSSIRGRLSG